MNTNFSDISLYKKTLLNGLTVIVKPDHTIPEVDIQLWYNVGSKHESDAQRGMAHLIEHMIFKGTQDLLSEGDLDGIVQKLAGQTNAFTSYDYTTYVFTLPSSSWWYALLILADCMQNARFDEQMLNSEFKAVIAELKMNRDNYQSIAIEQLMAATSAPHPYQYPIIGYKEDLWSLKRDDLFAFYKEHYYPGNATLIVVGDVQPEDVFEQTEHFFGEIPCKERSCARVIAPAADIAHKEVVLYREVSQPWCCFAFRIPGIKDKEGHIWYLLELLLGRGKTSRLYQKLVQELGIAVDVDCFDYSLFDEQLLYITITPIDETVLEEIEIAVNEVIDNLIHHECSSWELAMVKKKAQVDYIGLLESNEQFASSLGHSYLATGGVEYFQNYFSLVEKVTSQDIMVFAQRYLRATLRNKAYVLQLPKEETMYARLIQDASDSFDARILSKRVRTTPIEIPSYAAKIEEPPLADFSYPKPNVFALENGLDVYWYHNPRLPQISLQLHLRANFFYEQKAMAGLSHFHSKMLLEGTQSYSATTLHRFLEERGISFESDSGVLHAEFLAGELSPMLSILSEVLRFPAFSLAGLSKVREEALSDIRDFWDEPMSFTSQLARSLVYGERHPYSNFILGTQHTVEAIDIAAVQAYHDRYITPKGATLVIVGDLSGYQSSPELKKLLEDYLGQWNGGVVDQLNYPPLPEAKSQTIWHEIQRDQVVLAYAAPSISRLDPLYDQLILLDEILTGSACGSMSSRLFKLREQTGLFYTIGGSLVAAAGHAPGMIFLRTLVSPDNIAQAQQVIQEALKKLAQHGVSEEELALAKRGILQSYIGYFETNNKIASAFHFLKKYNFPLDLFDKRGSVLSIINKGSIDQLAARFCNTQNWSQIFVGRKHL